MFFWQKESTLHRLLANCTLLGRKGQSELCELSFCCARAQNLIVNCESVKVSPLCGLFSHKVFGCLATDAVFVASDVAAFPPHTEHLSGVPGLPCLMRLCSSWDHFFSVSLLNSTRPFLVMAMAVPSALRESDCPIAAVLLKIASDTASACLNKVFICLINW